jgi:hypothetical protein
LKENIELEGDRPREGEHEQVAHKVHQGSASVANKELSRDGVADFLQRPQEGFDEDHCFEAGAILTKSLA